MWLVSVGGKPEAPTADGLNCLILATQQGNLTSIIILTT